MDDICCHEDPDMQCRSLGDYAMACAKLGVVLGNWREKVPECGKELNFFSRQLVSCLSIL